MADELVLQVLILYISPLRHNFDHLKSYKTTPIDYLCTRDPDPFLFLFVYFWRTSVLLFRYSYLKVSQ